MICLDVRIAFTHSCCCVSVLLCYFVVAFSCCCVGVSLCCCVVIGETTSASCMLANSHEYLNMCGHTIMAWMWLRQEYHACRLLTGKTRATTTSTEEEFTTHFLNSKRSSSAYFFKYEVPKTLFQSQLLCHLDTFVDDAVL